MTTRDQVLEWIGSLQAHAAANGVLTVTRDGYEQLVTLLRTIVNELDMTDTRSQQLPVDAASTEEVKELRSRVEDIEQRLGL